MKLLKFFLGAGIPLAKANDPHAREFFQDCAQGAVGRGTLSDMIGLVENAEKEKLKEELRGKKIAVCFDGTTTVAEVYAIVVRWVDDPLVIQQRLLHLGFFKQSLRHQHIVAVLQDAIAREYQLDFRNIASFQRDRAAVNSAAMRLLCEQYPTAEDIPCFSHTLDHCGDHFNAPVLDGFAKELLGLLSTSAIARHTWLELAGSSFPSCSATRWWSYYDCLRYLHEHEDAIRAFLGHPDVQARVGKRITALTQTWQNAVLRMEMQLQLVAVVEIGKVFREATYSLEGDGPIAFIAYDELLKVGHARTVAFANMAYPAVQAKVTELAPQVIALGDIHALGNLRATVPDVRAVLLDNARDVAAGAFNYFTSRIWGGALQEQVLLFKAARLANPSRMASLRPAPNDVATDLRRVAQHVDAGALIAELPQYLALANGLQGNHHTSLDDLLRFWRLQRDELPQWYQFVRHVLLWQPSSAAAERVFSLLNATFGSNQESAKSDYISSSIMLQYNESHRRQALVVLDA